MSAPTIIMIAVAWPCSVISAWCYGAMWWNRKFTKPAFKGWKDCEDLLGKAIDELKRAFR